MDNVTYFPNFTQLWASLSSKERGALCRDSGVNYAYVWSIAHGYRKAGMPTIKKLRKIDKRCTPKLMRPDWYMAGRS